MGGDNVEISPYHGDHGDHDGLLCEGADTPSLHDILCEGGGSAETHHGDPLHDNLEVLEVFHDRNPYVVASILERVRGDPHDDPCVVADIPFLHDILCVVGDTAEIPRGDGDLLHDNLELSGVFLHDSLEVLGEHNQVLLSSVLKKKYCIPNK